MEINPVNQKIIIEFLAEWWESLDLQVQQTALGYCLPPKEADALYNDISGQALQNIAAAAEGQYAWKADIASEILDTCQKIIEWIWARPGMGAEYQIPAEWWATPLGYLVLRAHLWASKDELITISEASKVSGKTVATLSQLIVRKKITAYTDPAEPNPQKSRRLRRSDVDNLS